MSRCKNCGKELPLSWPQVGGVHMYCEQEYFHEKNQRMVRIRPVEAGPWCIEKPEAIVALINAIDDFNETYEFQVVMMSKGEVESLPEFGGW